MEYTIIWFLCDISTSLIDELKEENIKKFEVDLFSLKYLEKVNELLSMLFWCKVKLRLNCEVRDDRTSESDIKVSFDKAVDATIEGIILLSWDDFLALEMKYNTWKAQRLEIKVHLVFIL